MQLVANGPDIPAALLDAHEDGGVVFFCGAGIAYPAGLPGFKGLVDAIYDRVGTRREPIEQEAYDRDQFDATLHLLEDRLPGQRQKVRKALADVLQPKLRRKGATETHRALLQLARDREGALRLVTTNFDRIFARLTARTKPPVAAYPAPLLPIPKSSRWNGLVYLHGLLPEHPDESALNRLVLTSGDFGLAYLAERWAARFVSELFRNYVVCFVGYSLNDPVLRYMMDALAADRKLGERAAHAYAFGEYSPGQEDRKVVEWEAKGAKPILYEVSARTPDHSALHRTLKAWAAIYRDGILGKERIVVDYAIARPFSSTRQDDFVGRMLWALSQKSGLPAKRFADFDPVPSLDWLAALSDDRYHNGDLPRFGVLSHVEGDSNLSFSLVRRPASYSCAPWMALVARYPGESQWDNVMSHLARWLVRHLDDPALVLWLAKRGGRLHERLTSLIEERLNTFARMEKQGDTGALARIRAQAPNAVPRQLLRTLWRLLLTGRVRSSERELDHWIARFERDGLTASQRLELRELLAPRVELKEPFRWPEGDAGTDRHERLRQLVDWELVLTASDVSSLREMANAEQWRAVLPALLDDFQQLLRDSLDLLRELGDASDREDRSTLDLPSIAPHTQNRGFAEWVVLIELLRDAWLATREVDSVRASRIAQTWFTVPYAAFKRLALFAASHDGCMPPTQWVEWLLADDAWWLWSTETRRETLRLLVLQGRELTPQAEGQLEASILAGPPRAMYRDDLDPVSWKDLVDHAVWLRLAKLKLSGVVLGEAATEELGALSAEHEGWNLSSDESDEFPHWMTGSGEPDFEAVRRVDKAPRKRSELVAWLQRPVPAESLFYEDTWRETCRDRFFHCAFALWDLAQDGKWPVGRWREALQTWSEEGRVRRSWRFVGPLASNIPDEALAVLAHSVAWWLQALSKSLDRHEAAFQELCRRILESPFGGETDADQSVMLAMNHPVGLATEALLNLWFARKPNDNDGLPADLRPLFTQLCDTRVPQFRHGRVLLAVRIVALFRVDRPWTQTHLLPLFDWAADAVEARAVWRGFLFSPRQYRPLLVAFKKELLDTARHYEDLRTGAQFAAFLTYVAMDWVDFCTVDELRSALAALPQDGLEESARALVQALEGAGEQRESFWLNRILPLWQGAWPQSRHLTSKRIAERLARLSIAARGEFPSVLTAVEGWLQPLAHPNYLVKLLHGSGLARRFPADALTLLDVVIGDPLFAPRELAECLDVLSEAEPALTMDRRYRRLREYCRQRGAG